MAKKKKTFGKLLAFTTAAAAIGGTCYIFRDKIKQSSIYKASIDKASDIFTKLSDKAANQEDNDFFFDEDDDNFDEHDVFSEDAKQGREYTSITINSKEEPDISKENAESVSKEPDDAKEDASEEINKTEKAALEESIPTINFNSITNKKESDTPSSIDTPSNSSVTSYENEGLSDVSEDPDVLEEQDKLDF